MFLRNLAAAVMVLLVCFAPVLAAKEGDTRTGLFVGNTRFVAGDDTTYGIAFGLSFGYEFYKDLLLMLSAQNATTSGEVTVNGQNYPLEARANIFRLGVRKYFNRNQGSSAIYFAGGGLSALSYEIDYTYPGCTVCKTSGTGPGYYASLGMEWRMSKSSYFIPQFFLQSHNIQRESGEADTVTSSSFMLSLRLTN